MKKPKSRRIFEDQGAPIGIVRLSILKGIGVDVEALRNKPMIAVVNSHTDLNPGHAHLQTPAVENKNVQGPGKLLKEME